MGLIRRWVLLLYRSAFSPRLQHNLERIIIYLALIGLLLHLLLIGLAHLGWLGGPLGKMLQTDVTAAMYTPFSFILIYEVYLFVYYLPESFTISIGKQYEIVALIIIRRLFKDMAYLELKGPWFEIGSHNFDLLIDMIGVLVIFALIFTFYYINKDRPRFERSPARVRFIRIKKLFALALIPTLIVLALMSFINWCLEVYYYQTGQSTYLGDINDVFYHEFFVILVFVDLFILIVSLLFSQRFSQIMRNSGFIVSTVLIRLSFSTYDRLTNLLMLLGALTFGVLVSWVYTWYGRLPESSSKGSKRALSSKTT